MSAVVIFFGGVFVAMALTFGVAIYLEDKRKETK